MVKNLGKGMSESIVREELEALDIHVQAFMQLRSGRRDQDPAKDRPLIPHFIVSVVRVHEVSKVRSITEICGLRVSVESYVAPKGSLQCKRCQHFGHTQRNCAYVPRCVTCGGAHLTGGCSTPREQPQCCSVGATIQRVTWGCIKWKKAKAAHAKRASEGVRKSVATSHSAATKAQGAGPSAEQTDLGEGWNHVVRGRRVVKATTTQPQNPKPSPQPVTEAPSQPKVTATWKGLRSPSQSLQQPLNRRLGRQIRKQPQV